MKYLNFFSFQEHLKRKELAVCYAVISSCRFERKKMVGEILKNVTNYDYLETLAGQKPIEEALAHLKERSLFGGISVLFLDEVDRLSKVEKQKVLKSLDQLTKETLFLLGSSTSKGIHDFYTAGKKEMVACDLSLEKPWEKRKRLEKMLETHAMQLGKRLKNETAVFLIEHVGTDLSLLEQELDKLRAFCGERPEITKHDIALISSHQTLGVSWDWIDDVLFSDQVISRPHLTESELFPLIGQIRYKLERILEMSACFEQGMTLQEIHAQFPTFQRGKLEQLLQVLRKRKCAHFERALHLLFEIELLSKNSSLNPSLLLDLWIHKKSQELSFSSLTR